MYLSDVMSALIKAPKMGEVCQMSQGARYLRGFMRECLDARPHVFEASALRAAADIRIDTQDRLERLLEAVFRRKRKIFIESLYRDRLMTFKGLRGFPMKDLQPGKYEPRRIGILIDANGEGQARVTAIWDFPKSRLGPPRGTPGRRVDRDFIDALSVINGSFVQIEVDLEAPRADRSEFDALWKEDSLEKQALEAHARGLRSDRSDRVEQDAWALFRLNSFNCITPRPGIEGALSEVMMSSGEDGRAILNRMNGDMDGELVYAAAFLALLDAGPGALKSETRPARGLARRKPVSLKDMPRERLSVVTLDLADKGLEKALTAPEHPAETEGKGPSGRRSPVRHPVRGHLFLARSGRLVYRMPHWRGSAERSAVTRVRA